MIWVMVSEANARQTAGHCSVCCPASLRVAFVSMCSETFIAKRGFYFGRRPAFAVAIWEAGLVIPAYCLTAETFSDSVHFYG